VELPASAACLGGDLSAAILASAIGYYSVATNAFRGASAASRAVSSAPISPKSRTSEAYDASVGDGNRPTDHAAAAATGYVRAYPSSTLINLNHAAVAPAHLRTIWKVGALVTALFIMCTTNALVSFTLKEVQVRIVKLTIDLQYAMRAPAVERGYGLILLRYAMDALVFIPIVAGVLFFLFEFFDDQPLAFAVLVVAWLAEVAVSGSTRHCISRQYLPRLFFVYFGGFHFYFFSFPLGFTWLAFATGVAYMFHACLAIWNRFELPLMQQELESRGEWR
jgi:hypothetical protein